tara:strand:+ start:1402 stop:1773 length:372 start_codon:yes stop_codon:yes gene_type:complete
MEELTVAEILELIRINEEAMVIQFQTWLTITFATIVAVFAGRNLLTGLMRWLVTMLYMLASLAVTALSLYLAENNALLVTILASRDVAVAAPAFAGITSFVLFLAGVGTTVYFIHMKTNDESS